MAKKERIARYTADELRTKMVMGESRTDWQRVDATTAADIEQQAQEDEASDEWCSEAVIAGLPPQKTPVNIRLDQDIIDFFKDFGPGYQTRINSVLRSFVEHRRSKS
ncbi:BrnA antitoxin family protein [Acidiphilium sp. PA]|uniref:BrnA antitoxin family protein n=1 Tax=Acidiphilium sp. PA TaxID=2871705 RepID=UPI002242D2DE|nr:BrnA antitoxin family protein [Acidiphilium sp. PA]MCW8309454.1 BrnA antitoxin family protein [Acidiphilium sp. PA]